MTNHDVSALLGSIGEVLSIIDSKPFRANAYLKAARTIENHGAAVADMVRAGTVGSIPGVGKGIAATVTDIVTSGKSSELEKLLDQIPVGVIDLSNLQGLGPKKVRALWKDHDIASLDQLEQAIEDGRLEKIKGFGPKVVETIRKALQHARQHKGQFLLGAAWRIADVLLVELRETFHVKQAAVVGEARRGCETVRCLEVVAVGKGDELSEHRWIQGTDDGVLTGESGEGIPIRLHPVAAAEFPVAMHRLTGDATHVQVVASRLVGKDLKVSSEEELYERAGLPMIPPELREGDGLEVPEDLIRREDLAGVIHVHSTWSDGMHELVDMVREAKEQGFSYVGITDHSRSAGYANGLNEDRLKSQREAIEVIRKEVPGIRIFHGTECDILNNGSMDFADEVLRWLDFVVGSIHSNFGMDRATMTDRICTALRNPYVDVLGHPTGRLLLARPGYEVDLDAVLETCREEDKVIELNANPNRLDLDTVWTRKALDREVLISINPDAHNRQGLDDTRFGVQVARRARAPRTRVLNVMPVEQVEERFARRRR